MDFQRYWYIVLITQAIGYYSKYRERELQSSQLEAQLAYAQLEVLKIQLEPHFLFNTLNSIAALARNDGLAAENMTLQLADLLRFSLDAVGVHEVPLSRELTFLQKYIDIQQTRFQDRLLVEMDIQPHTRSRWCRTWCCSRWWKMPSAMASARAVRRDLFASRRARSSTSCGWRSATMARDSPPSEAEFHPKAWGCTTRAPACNSCTTTTTR